MKNEDLREASWKDIGLISMSKWKFVLILLCVFLFGILIAFELQEQPNKIPKNVVNGIPKNVVKEYLEINEKMYNTVAEQFKLTEELFSILKNVPMWFSRSQEREMIRLVNQFEWNTEVLKELKIKKIAAEVKIYSYLLEEGGAK